MVSTVRCTSALDVVSFINGAIAKGSGMGMGGRIMYEKVEVYNVREIKPGCLNKVRVCQVKGWGRRWFVLKTDRSKASPPSRLREVMGIVGKVSRNERMAWEISRLFMNRVLVPRPFMVDLDGEGTAVLVPYLRFARMVGANCVWGDEFLNAALFDGLIGNLDRSCYNILRWWGKIYLIDHERAFPMGPSEQRRDQQERLLRVNTSILKNRRLRGIVPLPEEGERVLRRVLEDKVLRNQMEGLIGWDCADGVYQRAYWMLREKRLLSFKEWVKMYA